MSIEAMKQALEALESATPKYTRQRADQKTLGGALDYWKLEQHQRLKAITSLRQAIAEAEKQEPVAWIEHHKGGDNLVWDEPNKGTPLYTHPQPKREPVALRSEQFVDMARAIAPRTVMGMKEQIPNWIVEFGRAVEAAHGIKENT